MHVYSVQSTVPDDSAVLYGVDREVEIAAEAKDGGLEHCKCVISLYGLIV